MIDVGWILLRTRSLARCSGSTSKGVQEQQVKTPTETLESLLMENRGDLSFRLDCMHAARERKTRQRGSQHVRCQEHTHTEVQWQNYTQARKTWKDALQVKQMSWKHYNCLKRDYAVHSMHILGIHKLACSHINARACTAHPHPPPFPQR